MRVKKPELTSEQVRFVKMEANGIPSREIIFTLWGIKEEDDPKKFHNAECKLSDWRKHPKYLDTWKEEVRNQDYADYSEARKTLRKTMRSEKDQWLAMNSAVNMINQTGKKIFGTDDNSITVKIEGSMPDIGSPDGNE